MASQSIGAPEPDFRNGLPCQAEEFMRIEARESPSWPEQSSAAGYITADCQRPTRKNPLADGGGPYISERTSVRKSGGSFHASPATLFNQTNR
jgi:hypothetical protein